MPAKHKAQHRMPRVRGLRVRRARARMGRATSGVRRTGLLVRFGLLSAALVAALGAVLAAALEDTVERRALAQAEQSAAGVARVAVQPLLERSDFESGRIAPERMARVAETLRVLASEGRVVRVKVFDRSGTLLYSDETDLIGERSMSADLLVALSGGIASEVEAESHEESERGLGPLLEVYVPVRMDTTSGQQVVGAFETYLAYGPIAAGVAEDVRQLLWCLGLGLVTLWAGLFQLLSKASRRLRRQSEENRWLAQHDALTGLPNRALFDERVGQAVASAAHTTTEAAVVLVDLHRFKDVNDTLGHHVGDALLKAVGERLRERAAGATVARLGGDEFAVLLPAVTGTRCVERVAADLLAAVREPVPVGDVTLEVDAAFGAALFPRHAGSGAALLQRADVALARAKQDHEAFLLYRPELDQHAPARLALSGELRRAIEEGQLVLHYQPKVDVASGRVSGVEALVRWQHPERGLLPPDDFIPVAEQTSLIRPLTLCLLGRALRDCRAWRDHGLDLSVAVNLSARNLLDADLPEQVGRLLAEHGVPADVLELEITETTAMVDLARALTVLAGLRDLGVGLSVDDYGTGHSSLSYLHRLPVDTLKIDRSFVSTMDRNAHEAAIVRSTIDLARSLGLQVVAEGVETETAWRQLRTLGCDAAQGYWLARPGATTDVPAAIADLEGRLAAAAAASAGTRSHEPAA